jgi:hypothetical protein
MPHAGNMLAVGLEISASSRSGLSSLEALVLEVFHT